jgi:hypothetical protein
MEFGICATCGVPRQLRHLLSLRKGGRKRTSQTIQSHAGRITQMLTNCCQLRSNANADGHYSRQAEKSSTTILRQFLAFEKAHARAQVRKFRTTTCQIGIR